MSYPSLHILSNLLTPYNPPASPPTTRAICLEFILPIPIALTSPSNTTIPIASSGVHIAVYNHNNTFHIPCTRRRLTMSQTCPICLRSFHSNNIVKLSLRDILLADEIRFARVEDEMLRGLEGDLTGRLDELSRSWRELSESLETNIEESRKRTKEDLEGHGERLRDGERLRESERRYVEEMEKIRKGVEKGEELFEEELERDAELDVGRSSKEEGGERDERRAMKSEVEDNRLRC
ncbi:hypothetical protein K469DRAFT_694206 [Zopfia rhizophila CBS 207.26]|uniref:Uncharacterized protein n=1 Tax=Zopfia rhizophila CBS 207.26 TaxID=1314779 RepID=A0A6A6DIF0_9PEZI|nr:hypothetical protein K469DRAFT_694206 [Zopfia rhizophila CBS 207.26]